MNKIILVLFVIFSIILIGTVIANVALENFCNNLRMHKSYIWLPKNVSNYFYSDKINLDFRLIGSIKELNISVLKINGIIQDWKITDLKCGSTPDSDYNVFISDFTAIDLATSKTPITSFRNEWKRGEIKIVPKDSYHTNKLNYADLILNEDNESVPENIREYFEKEKSKKL